jgi:hypothetical protein
MTQIGVPVGVGSFQLGKAVGIYVGVGVGRAPGVGRIDDENARTPAPSCWANQRARATKSTTTITSLVARIFTSPVDA